MTSNTADGVETLSASGTDVNAIAAAASSPPTPGEEGAQLQGHTPSKRIPNSAKLPDAPGLADDGSVLPVPSHVVLHHLSTSAIRNGVLAVANTTRYRKKVRELRSALVLRLMPTLRLVYHDDLLQTHMIHPYGYWVTLLSHHCLRLLPWCGLPPYSCPDTPALNSHSPSRFEPSPCIHPILCRNFSSLVLPHVS